MEENYMGSEDSKRSKKKRHAVRLLQDELRGNISLVRCRWEGKRLFILREKGRNTSFLLRDALRCVRSYLCLERHKGRREGGRLFVLTVNVLLRETKKSAEA